MRLRALEDAAAIRELNRIYVALVNDRAYEDLARLFDAPARAPVDRDVVRLTSASFGDSDGIDVATDRRTARAQLHCVVETEAPIEDGYTLVDMARAQGEGVVRRRERRVIELSYVNRNGLWKLSGSIFRSA